MICIYIIYIYTWYSCVGIYKKRGWTESPRCFLEGPHLILVSLKLKFWLCFWSRFLELHTPTTRRLWSKWAASCHQMKVLDWVLGSWLWTGQALAAAGISRVNQWVKALQLSLLSFTLHVNYAFFLIRIFVKHISKIYF